MFMLGRSKFAKEIRIAHKKERDRRSVLLYGVDNMTEKILNMKNDRDQGNFIGPSDKLTATAVVTKKKNFKDYFLLNPEGRFLSTFDGVMLVVVAYSCFTSAYYTAFDFPEDVGLVWMEHITTLFFCLDIIFNCMRMYHGSDGSWVREH